MGTAGLRVYYRRRLCGPSFFGPAIISRVLEAHGYKICMIPQPDWKDDKSIDVSGRPRLGFLVSGGNMDSMVNHYTVSKNTEVWIPILPVERWG